MRSAVRPFGDGEIWGNHLDMGGVLGADRTDHRISGGDRCQVIGVVAHRRSARVLPDLPRIEDSNVGQVSTIDPGCAFGADDGAARIVGDDYVG